MRKMNFILRMFAVTLCLLMFVPVTQVYGFAYTADVQTNILANEQTPCEHDLKLTFEIKATCTNEGIKTFTCETCGETMTETISALGHTTVTDFAVPPTCTATGLSEGSHCITCGEVIVPQRIIDSLGHSWNEGEITAIPTCTNEGTKTFTCETCGEIMTETISALGHTAVTDFAVPPSCTATGLSEGSHCITCGEVIAPQRIIDSLGHSWNEGEITAIPTCTNEGIKTYTCETCGEIMTETISALGHTTVTDFAVPPSCTATGLSEGSHCITCGEVIIPQKRIQALGHNYIEKVILPTCIQGGYTIFTCSQCNNSYKTNKTPASDHVWDEGELTAFPTYLKTGEKVHTCDICAETMTEAVEKLVLERVTGVESTSTDSMISLSWPDVTDAQGYRIFKFENGVWKKLKDVSTTFFDVKGLDCAETYQFCVKAFRKDGNIVSWGKGSASYFSSTLPSKVVSLTGKSYDTSITLKWAEVSGATKYRVYKYNSQKEIFEKYADVTTNYCVVKSISKATTCYFTIKACKTYGSKNFWGLASDILKTTTLPSGATSLKTYSTAKTSVVLSWAKVSGATGYAVYQYKNKKWVRVATVSSNAAKIKYLKSGTNNYFKVRAYKSCAGSNFYGAYSTNLKVKTK